MAIHRGGNLAKAARALDINETTVSRRIAALEAALCAKLFTRNDAGKLIATDTGVQVITHAETIESETLAITETANVAQSALHGHVRITSVSFFINRMLLPRLPLFFEKHPNVTIDLVPDGRSLDLTQREADLAVRFARPKSGGIDLVGQKIGSLDFSLYCPAKMQNTKAWVSYEMMHRDLPQARWINSALSKDPDATSPIHVTDVETALEAVAAGLGKTLLPSVLAENDKRVIKCPSPDKLPSRDLWLLSHRQNNARAAMNALKTWMREQNWSHPF